MFSSIKKHSKHNEQMRKVRKWLSESQSTKVVSSMEDMDHVFDESMQAAIFLEEFQKVIDPNSEVEWEQEILEMRRGMDSVLLELRNLLLEDNRHKDGRLERIFEQLRTKTHEFYTFTLALKNQDTTHEEKEIEIKWLNKLKSINLLF